MPALWLDRLPLPNLPAYTVISVGLLLCSIYFSVTTQEGFENAAISRVAYTEGICRQCMLPYGNQSVADQKTSLKEYFLFISAYPSQKHLLHYFIKHKLKSDFLYWPAAGVTVDSGQTRLSPSAVVTSTGSFYVPHVYYSDVEEWRRSLPSLNVTSKLVKTLAFMIHEPLCVWVSRCFLSRFLALRVLCGGKVRDVLYMRWQCLLKMRHWAAGAVQSFDSQHMEVVLFQTIDDDIGLMMMMLLKH